MTVTSAATTSRASRLSQADRLARWKAPPTVDSPAPAEVIATTQRTWNTRPLSPLTTMSTDPSKTT